MISSIQILNFQSHKKASVELSDGINILIGSSDSGKSAFIRALNWLANNRPAGESFRSNWGGDTSVHVEIGNQLISRKRSNKENEYEIVWDVESAKMGEVSHDTYKALGSDIPEEVKKLLNFEEMNIQSQMDMPFLLGKTSGEVARYLNQIVNLEVIDTSLAAIEKQRRESISTITYKIDDLKGKQYTLEEFSFVDKLEKDLNILTAIQNKFSKEKEKYSILFNLLDKIDTIQHEISEAELKNYPKTITKIDGLLSLSEKIKAEKKKLSTIESIVRDIEIVTVAIHQNTFDPEIVKKVDYLFDLKNKITEEIQNKETIEYLIDELHQNNEERRKASERLRIARAEYERLTPDICPLCGAKTK